jgi:hypothetical protein
MEPAEPLDPRVEKGKKLVEYLWFKLAKQIVKLAGETYGWDEEQWDDAKRQYLRPSDYKVIVKY